MANNNKQPLIASVVVAAVLCLLLGVSGEDSPAPAGGPGGGESILDAAADVGGNGGPMACMGKLGPCEKFLSEPSSEPSPECCTPMKEVVTKDKVCLCTLFKNAELLKSVNMTQDNALGIAKKCGADADPSICKDVSASFKEGKMARRGASVRPSLDADEFINLLHGSNSMKMDLNRLENEVRDFVFSSVRERETLTHNMRSNIVEFAYILDSLGFNVKAGYQGSTTKLRVPFPRQAADRK
nr:lipid transfer-like protein VAS [Ipomoea batatas]